jgi:hypothetical protein
MEPHRFRPHLTTLEAREVPSATPADVVSAAIYVQVAGNVLEVYADRLAGPLRSAELDQYKNVIPQVALAEGWAAQVLTEFQVAVENEIAADPANAAALLPLAAQATALRSQAVLGTAAADIMGVSIGVPSVVPKLAAMSDPPADPPAPGTNPANGTTPTTDPGTNSGTTPTPTPTPTQPLSTSDDSGMSATIPALDDPHWQAMPDGLRVWDVVQGSGTPVQASSNITVFYTGWLKSDGTQFETDRGSSPNTFALNGLIKGWQEALVGMEPGGLRRLDVPAALAYGSAGSPPKIPANADLVFEIKMLAVN